MSDAPRKPIFPFRDVVAESMPPDAIVVVGHAATPPDELERLRDAVHGYLTAWDAKDAADCVEDAATNLPTRQRLGRMKARALSALRAEVTR